MQIRYATFGSKAGTLTETVIDMGIALFSGNPV